MHTRYVLAGVVAAASARSVSNPSPRDVDPTDQPSTVDPCAAAVASQSASAAGGADFKSTGDILYAAIDAQTAWDCVQSVPFDADGAITMLDAFKQYMSMHTTVAYLKDPPKSYQQPAVDVMGRLDEMVAKVKNGGYKRHWDFEADLYSIEVAVHDEHFNMPVTLMKSFFWFLPYSLVSISSDGKALPQVYVTDDVMNQVPNLSPVEQIEGKSVFEYLHGYNADRAAAGLTEPHADWNVLMWNEAYQFGLAAHPNSPTYQSTDLEGTRLYNGPSLKGRFANGTTFEWEYYAGSPYNLTGMGMTSGQEIFDNAIANTAQQPVLPTSVDTASFSSLPCSPPTPTPDYPYQIGTPLPSSSSFPTATAVPYGGWPEPDTKQSEFGVGGSVSGYLLKDASIGVLSLPSFESGAALNAASYESFSDAVADFIKTAHGMKQVVIDLRGNLGGSSVLAYDVFKQFFPTVQPSLSFRTRATDTLNTIGKLFTGVSDNEGGLLSSCLQEYALSQAGIIAFVNSALSETPQGDDIPAWSDFYGPDKIHNDEFTNLAQYNLSSPYFAQSQEGVAVAGYGNRTVDYPQPWRAEDIIILTDGTCGSTCSIFFELMKTDGGVRSIAIGGIPEYGPMQAVAGTRGSNVFTWDYISATALSLRQAIALFGDRVTPVFENYGVSVDEVTALPPQFEALPWRVGGGRFNSLDEIRAVSPQDPLQFSYQAADCRLFYTGNMVRDVTATWRAAAGALASSGDGDLCVKGSRNAKGAKVNETVMDDPGFNNDKVWKAANTTDAPSAAPLRASGNPSVALLTAGVALALALVVL